MQALDEITQAICDSDFDGLMAGAILKRVKPEINVIFSHAALIRSGAHDDIIARNTALCDLPFHPNCGLYLDHHLTNKPNQNESEIFQQNGGILEWHPTPSAARAAFDFCKNAADLSDLEEMMLVVDALDSGGVSKSAYLEDGFLIRLSRSFHMGALEHMHEVCGDLVNGINLLGLEKKYSPLTNAIGERRNQEVIAVKNNTTIINRLAICRLEEQPYRVSGYLVTSIFDEEVDACCIIHGYMDGSVESSDRPALSASFYANSFSDSILGFDLSVLATHFDTSGGGHKNACGCRIKPLSEGFEIQDRPVCSNDIDRNLEKWLDIWASR
ncbi:MAG TPA: hypothetical protein D7H86_07425 [Candidatus Poseidoniales archaeon]|nr:hypothetical protein [Euryarchaeota archaeon]DAC11558.1 MAG TPA: hypothetical protein D7H86_07425 [Candidatus Poseidoniales archaeon]